MSFKMFTGIQDEEYRLVDSLVEEQYLVGGVTAWVYAFKGAKVDKNSNDATKNGTGQEDKIAEQTIGNLILMETPFREYSLDAVEMPVVYQAQDAQMDLQIPGLFLFETMDVTLPYNLMIERFGRKIMNGDVIELANLRDNHLLDDEKEAINRFYVVHDAFKAANGYSHTWFHHIWKLRLVPITDSPEFKDLLGSAEDEDALVNSLSTAQKELNIMDLIVKQADSEAPYYHWDNEHIAEDPNLDGKYENNKENHQDQREAIPPLNKIDRVTEFPQIANDGQWVLRVDMTPNTLFKYENNRWRKHVQGGRYDNTSTDNAKARLVNSGKTLDEVGNIVETNQRVASADVLKPTLGE